MVSLSFLCPGLSITVYVGRSVLLCRRFIMQGIAFQEVPLRGSGWRGVCVYVNMLHLSKELSLEDSCITTRSLLISVHLLLSSESTLAPSFSSLSAEVFFLKPCHFEISLAWPDSLAA